MSDLLKERLKKIEAEISTCIPENPSAEWLNLAAGPLQQRLAQKTLKQINAPARALLDRGGKRWRPLFMLFCCELCGGGENALPLTPLVEIPHNGSLIIDDIEDNSSERRGGAAIHLLYGTDLAINSGNYMYFLPAFLIDKSNLGNRERLRVYESFMENLRRLHLGQGLDILWHRDHGYIPGVAEYLQMCRLKTGSLARMAAQIGVIAARGSVELADYLGKAAEDFGAAFQIIDDVKNLSSGIPGKQRGDDIIEGKKSLPVILHLRKEPHTKEELKELFEKAAARVPSGDVKEINKAIDLLTGSGSLQEAEVIAGRIMKNARQMIVKAFPYRKPYMKDPLELLLKLIDSLISY
ncbi:MAG TPA: polyprenyl synthetase family protein [Spirochaetales bacterium]|nr:polyprenyl synthetase family protein [Spirochaetales bacterium]